MNMMWLLFGSTSSLELPKMPPFKKTLAEFYSLISLLIKPSLLRCENDSRLVINCWRSHYFKKDLAPKGDGVVQSTIGPRSAPLQDGDCSNVLVIIRIKKGCLVTVRKDETQSTQIYSIITLVCFGGWGEGTFQWGKIIVLLQLVYYNAKTAEKVLKGSKKTEVTFREFCDVKEGIWNTLE